MRVMKKTKILFAALLSVCLSLGMAGFAFAAETPDESAEGSITIKLSYDGESLEGGAFAIYEAGDVSLSNGDYSFVLSESFSGFSGTLEDLENETLAEELYEYIEANGISPLATSENSSGEVVFDSLSIGLYLVVQTESCTGYELLSPFLVSLPIYDETSGSYVYDVSAYGKFALISSPEEETTTAEETTAGEEETESEPKLPQTGQLNWPIPVLAVTGLALIITGRAVLSGSKKRRGDAA